jgi:CheY-like chemotaxis protein
MMGGSIWAESSKGKGSIFHFAIVFETEDEYIHTTETAYIPIVERSFKPASILLVEDDYINQIVLKQILEEKGHNVEVAADGREALSILQQRLFDIILMDIQMPKMNGIEATKILRRQEELTNVHTPIIALTAHALRDDREKFLAAGMDDYISKPVDLNILYRTIDWLVKNEKKVQTRLDVMNNVISEEQEFSLDIIKKEKLFKEIAADKAELIKNNLDAEEYDEAEKLVHFLKVSAQEAEISEVKHIAFRMELALRRGDYNQAHEIFNSLEKALEKYN